MLTDQGFGKDHVASVAPATQDATVNGTGVDLANAHGALVIFLVGIITDGTHTPTIEESDDDGDTDTYAEVAASDLVGTLEALASNTPQAVSYVGAKRYIRAVSAVTGGPSTGGVYGALVQRGPMRKQPA